MVKITIENKGNIQVDNGEVVLAFVLKPDKVVSESETHTPTSSYLCGYGNSTQILKNVSVHLGAMVNELSKSQARRAFTYAQMLNGLRRGFEGEDIDVHEQNQKPCGCDSCPMEDEEDKEDGKEAD